MKKFQPKRMPAAVGNLIADLRYLARAKPIVEQPGPIDFEVGNEGGAVFLRFTRPVTNVGLSTEQAKQFSRLLLQQAVKAAEAQAAVIEKASA